MGLIDSILGFFVNRDVDKLQNSEEWKNIVHKINTSREDLDLHEYQFSWANYHSRIFSIRTLIKPSYYSTEGECFQIVSNYDKTIFELLCRNKSNLNISKLIHNKKLRQNIFNAENLTNKDKYSTLQALDSLWSSKLSKQELVALININKEFIQEIVHQAKKDFGVISLFDLSFYSNDNLSKEDWFKWQITSPDNEDDFLSKYDDVVLQSLFPSIYLTSKKTRNRISNYNNVKRKEKGFMGEKCMYCNLAISSYKSNQFCSVKCEKEYAEFKSK
jgi:hypothetical protein